MTGTSGNAVNMNGTWRGCTQSTTTNPQDVLTVDTLSGNSETVSVSQWNTTTTANCTQSAVPDYLIAGTATNTLGTKATATWTNGSGSTSPPTGISASANATAITRVIHSLTMTLGTVNAVNGFNTAAICGKTNWAIGVTTDVLNCTAIISSTTQPDYWVVDDSASVLKWYSQSIGTAPYQVDSINPLLK
jgi:hypothetical protein